MELRNIFNQPVRIAVVGRPNAGKSTFTNSLFGRNILPDLHATCTAVTTEVFSISLRICSIIILSK